MAFHLVVKFLHKTHGQHHHPHLNTLSCIKEKQFLQLTKGTYTKQQNYCFSNAKFYFQQLDNRECTLEQQWQNKQKVLAIVRLVENNVVLWTHQLETGKGQYKGRESITIQIANFSKIPQPNLAIWVSIYKVKTYGHVTYCSSTVYVKWNIWQLQTVFGKKGKSLRCPLFPSEHTCADPCSGTMVHPYMPH